MVFSSVAVIPLIAIFGLVDPAPGGGSQPGSAQRTLGLTLSSKLVTWGSPVTASGRAPELKRGSTVRLVLNPDAGQPHTLGTARIGRDHAWRTTIRATREGEVFAVGGGTSARSAAVGPSQRLELALRVSTSTDSIGGRRGTRVRLAASVKPAHRVRWILERRIHGRWRGTDSGFSNRNGGIAAAVKLGSKSAVHRIRVEGAAGLAGNTSPRVRSRPLRPALASWYDLYGEGLACGGVLRRNQLGVAHKTLPCGTKVTIRYRGRTLVAPVIDRGPYVGAREFDLTGAVARRLHFDGVGTIWVSP